MCPCACVVSDVLRFFAHTQLSQNLKVIVCLILDSCSHQSCYIVVGHCYRFSCFDLFHHVIVVVIVVVVFILI